MTIPTAEYVAQSAQWPSAGRHILAHYDDETIVVYQAYSPTIGAFAAERGYFERGFSYARMSWIKPNFLWMMYRSDWGRAVGQEVVLAIRLRRTFFDGLLERAVPSSFTPALYAEEAEWRAAVERSDVRLQWDPDHLPTGEKCERRAVQLGLRGETLAAYGRSEAVEIVDVSPLVAEQRQNAPRWAERALWSPVERVYIPADRRIAEKVGLDVTVNRELVNSPILDAFQGHC